MHVHESMDDVYIYMVDLELTIDPALPPGGIFGTMIFLYLMVCSIQKKMIAKLCWGFKELWVLKFVTT